MEQFDIINAMQKTGMSPAEYERIYEPNKKQNGCCVRCKKSFDGCSWSREGKPVQGWIAEKTEITGIKDGSYKIYFCPEYKKDNRKASIVSDGAAVDLLVAIIADAERSYRNAIRTVLDTTEKLKDETVIGEKRDGLYRKPCDALAIIEEVEQFLPKVKTEKIKREFPERK